MKDFRVFAGAFFSVAMAWAGLTTFASPAEDRIARPAAAVAVQGVALPQPEFREEAAMVVAGAALIGLAAAVRRAA